MQIKSSIIITIVSLAAANASPIVKRAATWEQCMTIASDPNQGMSFYGVPTEKQAEVAKDCRTCIMQNAAAGCQTPTDACRASYDACAASQNITLA